MKTRYVALTGAGLLCLSTLVSCKNDEIEIKPPVVIDPIACEIDATLVGFQAPAGTAAGTGRVGVAQDGISLVWGAGDSFRLWNSASSKTFDFEIAESQAAAAKAAFTGSAFFDEGDALVAFYPLKGFVEQNGDLQFALSVSQSQPTSKPAYEQSLLMIATQTASKTGIGDLTFRPQTALFRFTLRNRSNYKTLDVKSIKITSDKEIFPTVVSVKPDGTTASLSGTLASVELDLNDQQLAGEDLTAYMSLLPSAAALDPSVRLTVTVTTTADDATVAFVPLNHIVEYLYPAGSEVAEDGYRYVAGKVYDLELVLGGAGIELEGPDYEDGEEI